MAICFEAEVEGSGREDAAKASDGALAAVLGLLHRGVKLGLLPRKFVLSDGGSSESNTMWARCLMLGASPDVRRKAAALVLASDLAAAPFLATRGIGGLPPVLETVLLAPVRTGPLECRVAMHAKRQALLLLLSLATSAMKREDSAGADREALQTLGRVVLARSALCAGTPSWALCEMVWVADDLLFRLVPVKKQNHAHQEARSQCCVLL